MGYDALANFAYSTVATAPSPATSGTSLIVAAGDGARFPAVPFNAVVWPVGALPLATNAEIVRVTNIATDTLTIVRAQESSSARTIVAGDQIDAAITRKTLVDLQSSTALFGDGSDGTVTISVTTALTRDMMYDTLTVNSGVELRTAGFRIFVKNTLTCDGTILHRHASSDYDGLVGGFGSIPAGSVGTASNGGAGANGAGSAGTNQAGNQGFGAAGGAGGTGAGGAGGAGGTAAASPDTSSGGGIGAMGTAVLAIMGRRLFNSGLAMFASAGGGGGGGGNSTQPGPGAGCGGGYTVVTARALAGAGRITARGGNGAAATNANTGGSGGGGGGTVVLVSNSPSHSLTVDAPGGTGGAGNGTGTGGSNGATGRVFTYLGA